MAAPKLDGMLAQARAQQQQQEQVNHALQASLQQPHTVETYALCTVALRTVALRHDQAGERQQPVLMIATPDGKRRDVMLSPAMIAGLGKAFTAETQPEGLQVEA